MITLHTLSYCITLHHNYYHAKVKGALDNLREAAVLDKLAAMPDIRPRGNVSDAERDWRGKLG